MIIVAYAAVCILAALVTATLGVVLQLSVLEVLACAFLAANTAVLSLALWLSSVRDPDHMSKERRPPKRWKTNELAYLGALLGMVIASVHVFSHVIRGELSSESPFLHFMTDLMAGTLGVASLFASVANFRNWLARA